MAMQSVDQRIDTDPVLIPMQVELDQRELMKLRGGLTLMLMGLAVPILLLVELRYILVGTYISPHVHQGIGIAGLLVMIVAGIFNSLASKATKQNQPKAVLTHSGWAIFIGLIAWVLIGIQVVNRSMPGISHYGETYLVSAGTVDVYITFTLLAVYAARSRVKRLGDFVKNYWGVQSSAITWWFVTVVWLVIYIELYLI